MLDRNEISEMICSRLQQEKDRLREMYQNSSQNIGYFFIDDVLPVDIARKVYESFPRIDKTKRKRSLYQDKHIAVQMNEYDPLAEEAIYAFQQQAVLDVVGEITGIKMMSPDENLYAGGLSLMGKGNFLNPHLDNSHDKDRQRWRVLNLLYYVTPDWETENGGNLELWPNGPKQDCITVESKFNRLAVMATHDKSWHSVSQVNGNGVRCCVSNYYFSEEPLVEGSQFHITSFRGRPEQKLRDKVLQADIYLRSTIRKVFKNGIRENPHVYKGRKP